MLAGVVTALSIGDSLGARWAVLACAALALLVGVIALLRLSGRGPGTRGALERLWTALPLVLLVALVALSVREL
jgi:hypothetical protein